MRAPQPPILISLRKSTEACQLKQTTSPAHWLQLGKASCGPPEWTCCLVTSPGRSSGSSNGRRRPSDSMTREGTSDNEVLRCHSNMGQMHFLSAWTQIELGMPVEQAMAASSGSLMGCQCFENVPLFFHQGASLLRLVLWLRNQPGPHLTNALLLTKQAEQPPGTHVCCFLDLHPSLLHLNLAISSFIMWLIDAFFLRDSLGSICDYEVVQEQTS